MKHENLYENLYAVSLNQRGVPYLHNIRTGEVISKKCTRCSKWHYLHGFNKAAHGFADTQSYCRRCDNKATAEWIKTKRELVK